jgi:hypothetical protein
MSADMPNFQRAITLEQWVELMKRRKRNLTDPHPGIKQVGDNWVPGQSHSIIDVYLNAEGDTDA